MKSKAKVTKSNKFWYFLVFAAVLVAGTLLMSNKLSTRQLNNGNLPTTSPEVRAKLAMVKYSVSKAGVNNVLVSSSNYGFEMTFPNIYEFDTGRGFNKDYPEHETVDIGAVDKEEVSDLVYNVSLGFTNNRDLNQLVEEEVFGLKRNVNPSPKLTPSQIENIDIKLKKNSLIISGTPAIRIQFIGAFGAEEIVYYLVKGDKYYRISALTDDHKLFIFTPNQLVEIDRVIRSFKFN